MKTYTTLLFTLLCSTLTFAQTFTDSGIALTGVNISSVAWGDYDNDGDLDILISGYSGSFNLTTVYKNNGDGTFSNDTAADAALTGVRASSVAWGDYDNDGDLDILLTGWTGSSQIAKIYSNNGAGSFTELGGANLAGVYNSSVAWGDYDNDGDLDILLTGWSNSSSRIAKIYTNNGSGGFTDSGIALTGVDNSSVAWGDYDNDGDLDILLTGFTGSSRIAKIYTNNGSGGFTDSGIALTGVENSSVAWGDYDNDGDLDILISGYSGSFNLTTVYKNNGDGTFSNDTAADAALAGVYNSSVAWGDYDNDGDLDILISGHSGSFNLTTVYKNNGDGTFSNDTATDAALTGLRESSVAWGDYDNDGDLDILVTGWTESGRVSRIYTNNSSTSDTKPAAPINLNQTVATNQTAVTFSWDAATDTETPANGLSYNVFIKENPVGTPTYVKSPQTQENDGWRKLPALGNAMQNTSYTWQVPAAYCGSTTDFVWKVQAIDHAFAGSDFSAGGSFSVSPAAKTIYVNANVSGGNNDGSSWANAYNNLQDALNNVETCTREIWVAQGTYKPTNETTPFTIPDGITLLGGFDGTETTADARDWATNPTILSGDLDSSGTPNTGDAHTIVSISTNNVTIDGFVFENAYADSNSNLESRAGAGLFTYSAASDIAVNNTIFRNLTAGIDGDTSFTGVGGAVITYGTNVSFTNTLFHDNSARYGGAISLENGSLTLTNCTLAQNTVNNSGSGGALNTNGKTVNIINSLFAENTGTNANINGNTTSIAYSYLAGEAAPTGTGNLDGTTNTPGFVDAVNNDFSLQSSSTLIDKGNNTANSTTKELGGNTRIVDGGSGTATIDIGAYEYDATLSVSEVLKNAAHAYPVPVKDQLTLDFGVHSTGELRLHNMVGSEVLHKHIESTKTTLDMQTLPSGVYLLQIKTTQIQKTIKVVKE